MSQVLTEGVNLAVVVESTLGAATPPTTGWFNQQPNSLGTLGPQMKKIPRDPISKNRMKQKGLLVDMDSSVSWEADVTKDLVDMFLSGMFMSTVKHNGGTGVSLFRPTAVVDGAGSDDSYTVAASAPQVAGLLIYARGFANAANNGLKLTTVSALGTSIEVATGSLVAETGVTVPPLPGNQTVDIVGVQAQAGDVTINASGNLTSTLLDFTTLGLNVGQWIYLPTQGEATAMGDIKYASDNILYTGFARIVAIAAGLLTLERRSWTVGAADTNADNLIRIFFGRWCRNVSIDHADFVKPSYAFEVMYPNLGGVGTHEYEYPLGNHVDEWTWNLSLTDKATVSMMFTGTTCADPTAARVTGPSAALNAATNLGVSTATDLMRMRISNVDETGITTDFQNIKISFNNNVDPEKQLGTLGAVLLNVGKFEVGIEADCIFTSDSVVKAVRDNRTCSMDVALRNGDFGMLIDVDSMTLDSTDRKFETNKSVKVAAKATGFQGLTSGFESGITVFPYLPRV